MKKLFLFVFLLTSLGISAQNYISYYPFANLSKLGSPSFDKFLTSYGEYNKAYITKLPSTTQFGVGYGFGVKAGLSGHLLIPFEFSRMHSSTEVLFTDGGKREFEFRSGGVSLGLGYSLQDLSKLFYIYPEAGVFLERDRIVSTYTDGTGSFNPEALNGTFKSSGGKLFVGLGACAGSKHVKAFARAQYYFPIASTQLEDDKKVVTDYGTHVIPVDYPLWTTDPVDYYGDNVEDDFKGLNLSFGITFDIPIDE